MLLQELDEKERNTARTEYPKVPKLTLFTASKHLSNCFMVPEQKETPNSSIY